MHLFLTFSAALGNMSKLYCTRLHENCPRLHDISGRDTLINAYAQPCPCVKATSSARNIRSIRNWQKTSSPTNSKNYKSVVNEEIFVQASAEPNDCVKPNEQNRVYSNFAMASNRTFKNLFGLCRVQPKISKKWHYATGHTNNTTH